LCAAEDRLASEGIEVRRAYGDDDGPLQESLGSTWQASWIAEITDGLRSTEAALYVARQSGRYVGFCCYGLNRGHEVGPIGTDPGMRGPGLAGQDRPDLGSRESGRQALASSRRRRGT
jgi:hypothetical protein